MALKTHSPCGGRQMIPPAADELQLVPLKADRLPEAIRLRCVQ